MRPRREPWKSGRSSIRVGTAPFWYQKMIYTPREVWVVEGTPPPEHPLQQEDCVRDTKVPAVYMAETYDKKGDLWRYIEYGYGWSTGQTSGINYYTPRWRGVHRLQAKHETQFIAPGIVDHGASGDNIRLKLWRHCNSAAEPRRRCRAFTGARLPGVFVGAWLSPLGLARAKSISARVWRLLPQRIRTST